MNDFGQSVFLREKIIKWMDENDIPKAELNKDSSDFTTEEIKSLFTELVNETEVLKKQLADHLLSLRTPSNNGWLTSVEVINYLKISKRSLQRYRDSGALRYKVILGNYRYLYEDVSKIFRDTK